MTAPTPTATSTLEEPDLNAIVGTVTDDGEVEIKDFTLKVKRFGFRVDNDVFIAHAALGLPTMQDLVKVARGMGDAIKDGSYDGIVAVFRELLDENSADRFSTRITSKGDDAIDVKKQLIPILYWLLEKYGLRPTQVSSASSAGLPSETDGTTSTDGSLTGVTT